MKNRKDNVGGRVAVVPRPLKLDRADFKRLQSVCKQLNQAMERASVLDQTRMAELALIARKYRTFVPGTNYQLNEKTLELIPNAAPSIRK